MVLPLSFFTLIFVFIVGLIVLQPSYSEDYKLIISCHSGSYRIPDVASISCSTLPHVDIKLEENYSGTMSIVVPRMLSDSKDENCNEKPFTVYVDGNVREHEEINDEKIRTLILNIHDGETRIEIQTFPSKYILDRSLCDGNLREKYSPKEQKIWYVHSNSSL